jgi:hypothetical protein
MVEAEASVVRPVEPPPIVTTPAVGVIDPESPLIVVTAPDADEACHDGGAPLLAVKTYPGVALLASQEGTPELLVTNTPSFAVAKAAITFVDEAYSRVFTALVVG